MIYTVGLKLTVLDLLGSKTTCTDVCTFLSFFKVEILYSQEIIIIYPEKREHAVTCPLN